MDEGESFWHKVFLVNKLVAESCVPGRIIWINGIFDFWEKVSLIQAAKPVFSSSVSDCFELALLKSEPIGNQFFIVLNEQVLFEFY